MTEIILPMSCPYGYTEADLHAILGWRITEFRYWMRGQTMMLCEGRSYDYDQNRYVPSECEGNPHGGVVYLHDLRRFLSGREPVD